ncbi:MULTISPECIES: glutaredoxin 3 [Neisseria]|uniref:Glutaredoxin n=2 Tax=Neisseria TaxID=482 RepID=A0A1X3CRA4_9NEIS|nr:MULTISPECIES: glutaredoxin 3 [Neisseria]KPN73194.1 glutaredoxin [Neisseria sp. 74A18]OSI10289.1 glutaredoxin 3 [Neisseria zoodegmatis]OSI15685.1 glutaredoxin 3 [Neisseria dumasiana]OSI16251.1 glutaredoxin 3 [Neisseria dumasiana]OSI30619.1 glutaredoxin 3 [Neisseria dumasiana]
MQPVTMYTGPYCPYCTMAKQFLKSQGISEIKEIRVDQNPADYAEMQQITGQRSVPQIFIGNTHVGGFTDLYALHQRGGLKSLLEGETE